jgi:signal transduction histidine kinase
LQHVVRPEPTPRRRGDAALDFLTGGGEMGALMRSHDWIRSPLGPPERWPQSLRSIVGLLLNSKFPMFLVWGPELAFLYNDGYRPIFGGKHPAALGRPFAQVWSEIWDDIRPLVDRALAGEATFHENLPLTMTRNGYPEEVYFTFSYSPVRDEAGGVAGMFCACTETTEKVLAERQLRATEAELRKANNALEVERELVKEANTRLSDEGDRLRDLFRQAPGFMAVLRGPDHVFELVNDAFFQLVGHREIEGRVVREALPELEGQGFFELLDRVYATDEPFVGESMRIEFQRRPGAAPEERFVDFVYQPIRGADGQVVGIFVEGSDVSQAKRAKDELQRLNETLEERVAARTVERERAEAELRHAQKMEAVGQLTGGVAHDFNNLLQALTGCLQMIERRAPTPQVQPLVEAGQQAIDRGARLVQQLMAFARRQNLQPEAVDVRDRILGMSELLARALRADISVETMSDPELWPVEVDPTQLELAIINLAVNARDAMPGGGRLRIETRNVPGSGHAGGPGAGDPGAGDMVRIGISDTGSGMEPEILARAFEPFFTTKEVGKGSGLGLAQVYGFARQSGGRVEIDSEPGRGTRVNLFLPRTAKPLAHAAPPGRPAEGATRDLRVLLVEDDPIVGNMVAAALEDVGYRVVRTAQATEALAVLSSGGRVDLLFSDIVMPGEMSGLDLANEARRRRPGLPVVLTTGYSEEVARAEGVRVLRKPYRIAALVEILEAALRA